MIPICSHLILRNSSVPGFIFFFPSKQIRKLCLCCDYYVGHNSQDLPFHYFQQEKILPLLQMCTKMKSGKTTRSLHAHIITMGSDGDIYITNNLITAYTAAGEFCIARKLFGKMPERNVVSYNTIITACARHGQLDEAWNFFYRLMSSDLRPTQFTFCSILSSAHSECFRGYMLQPVIIKTGLLHNNAFCGTALLGLYGRHGNLHDAIKLFDEMPQKSVVTYNSFILEFARYGFLETPVLTFRELLRMNLHLSEYSLLCVLRVIECSDDLDFGEQIHGLAIKTGLDIYTEVVNSLLQMYFNCSSIYISEKLFDQMLVKDVVSWNTIITAYAKSSMPKKALELFLTMHFLGFIPTQVTLLSVISSFTILEDLNFGMYIHAKSIKKNIVSDTIFCTALVHFYMKCHNLEEGIRIFHEIPEKNIVSWNTLISGYSSMGFNDAIVLLVKMMRSDFSPNKYTFSSVLKCSSALELKQLHSLIIRKGYEDNDYVSSSIIASYATNGLFSDSLLFVKSYLHSLPLITINIITGIYNRIGLYKKSQTILSQVQEKDVISLNILIGACSHRGDYVMALELFKSMHSSYFLPDKFTFVSVLSVCSRLCNLSLGSSFHGLMIKANFSSHDTFVYNVLADMYSKCGDLESSVKVFGEVNNKNLISWTVLISTLCLHGYALEAWLRFKNLELLGLKPDRVTCLSVLSACRYGGLIDEGLELLNSMTNSYGIEPEMDHYSCVVDMLCQNGHFKEAERVISSMPFQPNAILFRAYLEGLMKSSKLMTLWTTG